MREPLAAAVALQLVNLASSRREQTPLELPFLHAKLVVVALTTPTLDLKNVSTFHESGRMTSAALPRCSQALRLTQCDRSCADDYCEEAI